MLLEPSGGLGVGQELELEFVIPDGLKPMKVGGRVLRRETPDRVAVQFIATGTQGARSN